MLCTCNNTTATVMIFSAIALYYGDTCIVLILAKSIQYHRDTFASYTSNECCFLPKSHLWYILMAKFLPRLRFWEAGERSQYRMVLHCIISNTMLKLISNHFMPVSPTSSEHWWGKIATTCNWWILLFVCAHMPIYHIIQQSCQACN